MCRHRGWTAMRTYVREFSRRRRGGERISVGHRAAARHGAHHGRRPPRADRRRRAGGRRPDRRGGGRPRGSARSPGDRRQRRDRDARHDRHPPAPVADRDARLRRRLDADPVLRLVLPRARPPVPARGHLRRQPAGRDRGDRRRRHHHRRLVARAADRRPRRRRGRGPAGGAGPVRAGVREHPGRRRGSGRRSRRSAGSWRSASGRPTTGSGSSWRSTSPATRRSRSGRRSRWPATWSCR